MNDCTLDLFEKKIENSRKQSLYLHVGLILRAGYN